MREALSLISRYERDVATARRCCCELLGVPLGRPLDKAGATDDDELMEV